ncbi:MAG: TolC family protein [Syntrophaceae bacterium]
MNNATLTYAYNGRDLEILARREQAKRMFQAGVATLTDVHDTEARYDSVLAKEIEAKNDLNIKMQALKRIVGSEPDGLNPLKKGIPLAVPEPESLEGWIEKAKMHHPLLKSYAHQIAYQEVELRKNQERIGPALIWWADIQRPIRITM